MYVRPVEQWKWTLSLHKREKRRPATSRFYLGKQSIIE